MPRRDCTGWIRSPFDAARAAECARTSPHSEHVGLNEDGRLITWTDDEEGAHRG